ncbi:FAD:protein FMN transferase [Ferrimonas pelagia]|uniref:FAD:protein FMN transferase n=1 Tax=Ferrimonas pelagia TaxID=1177826 RepID=A0ABP9EGV5_9GAMM
MSYPNVIKWLAPLGLALLLSGCGRAPVIESITGHTMGTTYHISWVAQPTSESTSQIQAAIDHRLEQVNDSMSNWRQESLISQFNRQPADTPLLVDADFMAVIRESVRLHALTQGTLDITVSPLVDLWGFGPDGRIETAPNDEAIAAARALTGLDHLQFEGLNLTKTLPGLTLNLSSVAKGYGVDVVAELLELRGLDNYLVEIGGELRVKGVKPDGARWRIAVEQPDSYGREIAQIIEPGDMAVATSGDYRIFFEENGERFSHIIDPRSGRPATSRVASATVLDPSAMTADGLAMAMIVLGAEASLALAEREDLAVMLIEKHANGDFEVRYSSAYQPYLMEK